MAFFKVETTLTVEKSARGGRQSNAQSQYEATRIFRGDEDRTYLVHASASAPALDGNLSQHIAIILTNLRHKGLQSGHVFDNEFQLIQIGADFLTDLLAR
ncbi:hypothetical protein CLAFUW4_05779 [Fulvia fulva]|uniref:Uncharacterized protein n=1 Tax=Passalora fulva TaxID=5499 RepID=A0A9Q8P8S3_PASFU|nr:uncharacterized protein CLAFUR5_05920 [Fulvia fulva]KAK4624055.1 hypothetical protein CLAFUR4_05773 [Fulvia fulva]KAK4625406.1 hypothetical protein CLAFUR0_05784 [Fulvia fulva]UJO17535.1 hypothetical protein CLAFUR5_05920 [Fulvia fulva]WPV14521.1 hypothetical protein CLAFUW4_05779 [Fulvia fulva]WPV30147.1 hypothetical protein CLAFUW7_05777 [Fulvia fulva]